MSFIYPGGDAQVTPNLGLATWGMDEVLAENMILIDAAFSGGGGTVTSVAMTGDGVIFNSIIPGSPITTAGTLAPSLLSQTANRILAGPTSGGAATPTFRALVAADIPALSYVTSVAMTGDGVIFNSTVAGSPITSAGTLVPALLTQTANRLLAGPTTGSAAAPTFRALVTADLPAGTGTVTSVAMTGDGTIFNSTVSGSPVTTAGTLAPALLTQTANRLLAGPATGAAAAPTFRALVTADLPAGTGTVTSVAMTGDGVIFNSTVSGSPITTSGTLAPALLTQTANRILSGPTSGGAATPTFRALVGADLPNPSSSSLGGIQSLAAVTSKWINTISTSGVPTATQPAFSDISGNIAGSQLPTTFESAGIGWFLAWWGHTSPTTSGTNAGLTTAKLIYSVQVLELITVRKISFKVNTAVAASKVYVALYDSGGTLVTNSSNGGAASTSAVNVTTTLGTPFTISPGFYYVFIQADTTGVTLDSSGAAATNLYNLMNANVTRMGTCANGISGAAVPGTLGVLTAAAQAVPFILFES